MTIPSLGVFSPHYTDFILLVQSGAPETLYLFFLFWIFYFGLFFLYLVSLQQKIDSMALQSLALLESVKIQKKKEN